MWSRSLDPTDGCGVPFSTISASDVMRSCVGRFVLRLLVLFDIPVIFCPRRSRGFYDFLVISDYKELTLIAWVVIFFSLRLSFHYLYFIKNNQVHKYEVYFLIIHNDTLLFCSIYSVKSCSV